MTKPTDEQIKEAVDILKKIEDYSFTPANSSNYFTHIASIPPLAKDAIRLLSGTPEPTKLDLSKPMQFRDPKVAGEFLGVLATDVSGRFPILVKAKKIDETIGVFSYTPRGRFTSDEQIDPRDLINIPEPPKQKREGWVVMQRVGSVRGKSWYQVYRTHVYLMQEQAMEVASRGEGLCVCPVNLED